MRVYALAGLLAVLPAAAGDLTLNLPETTLGQALEAVAAQAGLTLVLPADLPLERPLRVDLTGVPPLVALRAVTASLDGARWELREGTARLHWTPPTPARPQPGPPAAETGAPPVAVPAPNGAPAVGSGQWVRIPVYYHDAAALAAALGGRPLRYADLDPWYAALLGATPPPAAGRLPLPNGVSDLVGVDWLRGLLAR